jgi:hypothetical protein
MGRSTSSRLSRPSSEATTTTAADRQTLSLLKFYLSGRRTDPGGSVSIAARVETGCVGEIFRAPPPSSVAAASDPTCLDVNRRVLLEEPAVGNLPGGVWCSEARRHIQWGKVPPTEEVQ